MIEHGDLTSKTRDEKQMGRLYVLLHHDLDGLGKKGQIVTKEDFDIFVRKQIDDLGQFLQRHHTAVAQKEARPIPDAAKKGDDE